MTTFTFSSLDCRSLTQRAIQIKLMTSLPGMSSTLLFVLLISISALLATPAYAGRPMITDDAGLADSGACQLEIWTERAGDSNAHWLSPVCNPFGSTEFALGFARLHGGGEDSFSIQSWQIKQSLRDLGEQQIGLAVALEGEHLRHSSERTLLLNGIATVPLAGDAQLLHLNLGVQRERDHAEADIRATWGLAFDTEIAGATRAAIETFGVSGERSNWQLGLLHELVPGSVQIDASVGSALGRWSDTRTFTLGLVIFSPAFLR